MSCLPLPTLLGPPNFTLLPRPPAVQYDEDAAARARAIAQRKRTTNGRELPLAVDNKRGGLTEFVRVGNDALERPW